MIAVVGEHETPNEFWEYLREILDHRLEMAMFQIVHQITWGVPCGPTISMIPIPDPSSAFYKYMKGNV